MTEPNEMDRASLARVARLQQRRQSSAPRPTQEPARRRRRPHPAAGGRILAAGIGATTMFGITAVLAVEATAGTEAQPDAAALPAAANTLPLETTTVPGVVSGPDATPAVRGTLPPGFTVDDIDLASIPEGGVLTGELSEDGRPVVVVVHSRTTPAAAPTSAVPTGASQSVARAAAAAAPAVAAPTPLTATPVITEVRVLAAAPAPAATTSGS